MATQAIFQDQRAALNQLVVSWDRRLRWQQVSLWLPRSLVPGLLIGITVAILARTRPWLLPGDVLLITIGGLIVGFGVMLLAVWLWPRTLLAAARRFDALFGLQERISTAMEVLSGRIRSNEELVQLQVEDAVNHAQTVPVSAALPLIWRPREWLAVLILASVLALLLLLPNPQADSLIQNSAQRVAIADATEDLKALTEEIAANTTLTPEEREQILQALETAIDTMEEPGITSEEAFAALSDAQTSLQNQADQITEQQQPSQAAMAAAAEALRKFEEAAQNNQNAGSPIPSLAEIQQQLAQMSAEQRQQAADSLDQAAQALQQTAPDAAQAMQQAADAMRQGDNAAANEALQNATNSLQQLQDGQQNQQNSADALNQAAQDVQQSAQQLAQEPGQEGQQTDQQAGQQGQGQPQEQQQEGNQAGQQAGQQEGQQGQGQGQQPGQQQGNNPGQQSQSGQGQGPQGNQGQPQAGAGEQGQQSGQASNPSDASAPGAGDTSGGAGSDALSGQPQNAAGMQDAQNNNPDGQGERQFEPVYAPRRIGGEGGEGGEEIILEPDDSNIPSVEGEFAENSSGEVTVPYNQVFSDYADAANRALESDYIPLGLRDVVRDYFSSLEPKD